MNGGKDVRFGHDKRQVSVVPSNQVPLYNISNGELLTDEFGNVLTTEVDEYFLPDATMDQSTPVVFPDKSSGYQKLEYVNVGLKTVTYSNSYTNIIGIDTSGLLVGDSIQGKYFPDSTKISRIGIGTIFINNTSTNSSPDTEIALVKRRNILRAKSDVVWKVEEQFKESSEVSRTLLGVDRSEVQLGIFANVSSYGLDSDEFEFYSYNTGNSFSSWENRRNEIYGKRYLATRTEEVQESAIKIAAFPAPYSYPFGPKFEKLGFYNETLFNYYLKFIELGNNLYNYFINRPYPEEWKNSFLPPFITYVEDGDVVYAAGVDDSFAQIDTWTDTWRDIKDGILIDPILGKKFDFSEISRILGPGYDSTNTRPGYADNVLRYAYLQSRRVFRYQPGRISGFTFGLRSSTEPTNGITLEWGISNPTDQYVFRIESGQFYIVRRSTLPLEPSVLSRNQLSTTDQVRLTSGDPFTDTEYWTIKIPRSKFNGDPLDSNGPSGYLLDPQKVTMYKIEFGWYGAIGARFYAYIPVDNGEARWVVIHTLVIENSLGSPCLEDSYFRFKYSLNIASTGDIRTPQFLYKYGTSYYIDGGDEGTSQIFSVSSKQKIIDSINLKSMIGIRPKQDIINSLGVPIPNKKLIIPTSFNVSTDSLSEIKVVTCKGCPGFGYVYTPGLATTESGRYVDIEFTNPNTISAINDGYFTEQDIGAKIIAPSIYNAYIDSLTEPIGIGESYLSARIKGFGGSFGFNLVNRNIGGSLVLDRVTGAATSIGIGTSYPYPIRLSNYNAVAASDFALTGSKIEIEFLNPNSQDDYGHWGDFLIGVTNKKPDVSAPDTLNGFIIPGIGVTSILPNNEILFGDHTHSFASINEDGVETNESWGPTQPPLKMGIDYRIPSISGISGGTCSRLTIEVQPELKIQNVTEFNYEPNSGSTVPDPQGRRWVHITGTFPNIDFNGGQVAISTTTNTVILKNANYVGLTSSYTDSEGVRYSYIQVSEPINSPTTNFNLLIRPVRASGGAINKTKIYNYNPFPLYVVAKLKDNAKINNITIKETIGDFQRTISPVWYVNEFSSIDNAGGNADVTGSAPTNFKEVSRLSSAIIDTQNEQKLRPFSVRDNFYVGANTTKTVDMRKIFGVDRNVVTPDNNNTESTFIVAKKLDGSEPGIMEISLNYKEQ